MRLPQSQKNIPAAHTAGKHLSTIKNYYLALLNEFVDCTLPQDLQNDIHAHMDSCPRCKVFFKTYSLTISLSRRAETTCKVTPEQFARLKSVLISRLLDK